MIFALTVATQVGKLTSLMLANNITQGLFSTKWWFDFAHGSDLRSSSRRSVGLRASSSFLASEASFERTSLRSRRLEVVGTRKNGRARRRQARPLACLPCARPFSLSPITSKRLLRRLWENARMNGEATRDRAKSPSESPSLASLSSATQAWLLATLFKSLATRLSFAYFVLNDSEAKDSAI